MASKLRPVFTEGANTKAVRGLMIALAALVVLSVSIYGTVIYVQLMGKVFPDGPLLIACYMGAAANVLLMVVLLVGKFVWFRPGAHEVASWIVTGVELLVSILNMMLAFELASGQKLASLMQAWYYMAPVSPIFSMVGAIILIMTSTELRTKHREMELQEKKDQSNREFELAMHGAEIDTKFQYLGYIKTKLQQELNAPERHVEMQDHAAMLVSDVLSGISGIQSVPQLKSPQLPNERTIEQARPARLPAPPSPAPRSLENTSLDEGDAWLAQVNSRIEQERKQRLAQGASTPAPASAPQSVRQAYRSRRRGFKAADTGKVYLPAREAQNSTEHEEMMRNAAQNVVPTQEAGESLPGNANSLRGRVIQVFSGDAENGGDDAKKK